MFSPLRNNLVYEDSLNIVHLFHHQVMELRSLLYYTDNLFQLGSTALAMRLKTV